MIYKCPCCGRYIYPHDFEVDGVCPFCGCEDLIKTDEDVYYYDKDSKHYIEQPCRGIYEMEDYLEETLLQE